MNIFHKQQGQIELNTCCFYTATIHNFQHLLADDAMKGIVVLSLQYFVRKGLIILYGFAPPMAGCPILFTCYGIYGSIVEKTMAGSFAKYTVHQFRKHLCFPANLKNINRIKMTGNISFGNATRWQFRLVQKNISK